MADLINKGGASTPEKAARKFADCLLSGDYDGVLDVCAIINLSPDEAKSQLESIVDIYKNVGEQRDLAIEIGEAKIDGDEAEVDGSLVVNGKKSPWEFMAVKIDGKWFVNMDF